jgi:hypothetical protein
MSDDTDDLLRRLTALVIKMDERLEEQRTFNAEQRTFNAQQVALNERLTAAIERLDVTQARIETLLSRLLRPEGNGRDA